MLIDNTTLIILTNVILLVILTLSVVCYRLNNSKKNSNEPNKVTNNITRGSESESESESESDNENENENENENVSESENANENANESQGKEKNKNNKGKETHMSNSSWGSMNDHLGPQFLPPPLNMVSISPHAMYARDRAVIDDPLYPPLNRNSLSPHDNYRMVGYLVGEESQEDSWQLYGRKVNNSRSEFYVRPTNRNLEMKIPIQDSDFKRPQDRLRDIDNLPSTTQIENPLFNSSAYRVVSNPNTNYDSAYF